MMVLPFGMCDAETGLREAAADAEDQVRLVQEVMHGRRHGEAAGAERERMVLGKRALARQAGADRDRQQFGQPLQLVPGLRPMHALPGIEHRPLGGDEHLGGLAHRFHIGAGRMARAGT